MSETTFRKYTEFLQGEYMPEFLPVSKEDMGLLSLNYLDFICVTGDAYVDHPSFGIAIISRVLQAEGFSVGIIAQPDFHKEEDRKSVV